MTATAGPGPHTRDPATAGSCDGDATIPLPASAVDADEAVASCAVAYQGPAPRLAVPRHSAGLELLGEYQGSGFTEPKYLVRRGDGQVVQLSRLLYLVVASIDGVRDTEIISYRVSGRYGREVSPGNITYLIEEKLQPLGVTVPAGQDGDEVDAPRSNLLLVLKGHRVIFREQHVARIAQALAWLHCPSVVALVLASALVMDIWLFAVHGAMAPVLELLEQPILMLVVFALVVASLVFHEFGHASACRYGGARPGNIGCGLFLIWPSMYTDVTDVYRLGRGGRMRTDLGGVYFNVVFILGLAAGYFLTGQSLFLAAIFLCHFEIAEQLMPFVRVDGYYILGDLAGVPDLFGKIKPILLSVLPRRPVHPDVADLKRSAKVVVTAWVATTVPLLAAELGYVLWNLPRLLSTSLRSLTEQVTGTCSAFADGRIAAGSVGVLGSLMLVCPLAGGAYLSLRLGSRLVRGTVNATRGRTGLRIVIGVTVAACVFALATAWINDMTPKPLPPQPPIAPILQPGVATLRPPQHSQVPTQAVQNPPTASAPPLMGRQTRDRPFSQAGSGLPPTASPSVPSSGPVSAGPPKSRRKPSVPPRGRPASASSAASSGPTGSASATSLDAVPSSASRSTQETAGAGPSS